MDLKCLLPWSLDFFFDNNCSMKKYSLMDASLSSFSVSNHFGLLFETNFVQNENKMTLCGRVDDDMHACKHDSRLKKQNREWEGKDVRMCVWERDRERERVV